MPSMKPEECVDRLITMRNIETKSYACTDYIKELNNDLLGSDLHENRNEISAWMYRLLDAHNIDRNLAYHSMNLLDRFYSNIISSRDKYDIDEFIGSSMFELASLTALYLAMKLNTNQNQPVNIAKFELTCQGKFTAEDIGGMEMRMLTVLSWHVFPPTLSEYIENYVSLLNYFYCKVHGLPIRSYQALQPLFIKIVEVSEYLTELAVLDYFFVTKKASIVAFASVLVTMEMYQQYETSEEYCAFFTVLETIGLFRTNQDVEICRERLQGLHEMNLPYMQAQQMSHSERELSSPVSVTQVQNMQYH